MSSIVSSGVLTGKISDGQLPREVSLQNKTVVLSNQEQVIEADAQYDGLGSVTVPAVALENVTITPTSSQQTVSCGEGYDGLGVVTVEGASGGTDTLDTLMNTASAQGGVNYTMDDDNQAHTCYGFVGGLNVTLPSTITAIGNHAFSDEGFVLSISGPGVITVGSGAFARSGCGSFSLPVATTIGAYAFSDCGYLTSLDLPAVTGLADGLFEGATPIANLYLGLDDVVGISGDVFGSTDCTVHVPAALLSQYEGDPGWTDAIQAAAEREDPITVTLAGDYGV